MKRLAHPVRNTCQAARLLPDQRGVALVITLLMLVIITVMAVAFLLLSQRETASVSALHSTTDAELAADAAVEQTKAVILKEVAQKFMGPDLKVSVAVSTNRFLDPASLAGFATPPVFVNTNRSGVWDPNVPLEDRYYLDLNENTRFEETGVVKEVAGNGNLTGADVAVTGDPQWLGLLQDPARPHSGDNRFIARYCYLIQPIGLSLDVNWIHNDVKRNGNNGISEFAYYFRNQGVGSFENNLAAFFTDLNPNHWHPITGPYFFNSDPTSLFSSGAPFNDALSFLRFRSAENTTNVLPASKLFGPPNGLPPTSFQSDFIDNYGNGLDLAQNGEVQTGTLDDHPDQPWPGASSPRNFFSIRDFLDRSKLPPLQSFPLGFVDRMSNAVHHPSSTFDRYTYYRMLEQLGTDGTVDDDRKINLNYKNTTNLIEMVGTTDGWYLTNDAVPALKASQLIDWPAFEFFNRVADTLLTNEFYPRGITHIGLIFPRTIPVYTNGSVIETQTNAASATDYLYSPRIHQLLQIAANLYEGTVSNKLDGERYPFRPSVYRPVFKGKDLSDGKGVGIHIVGYKNETDYTGKPKNFKQRYEVKSIVWKELAEQASQGGFNADPNAGLLFFDVPIIFGVRQGFPTLSELVLHSEVVVQRRMRLSKNSSGDISKVERAFSIGVSNVLMTEFVNPYTYTNLNFLLTGYPRPLSIVVSNQTRTWLHRDGQLVKADFNPVAIESNRLAFAWRTNDMAVLGGHQIQESLPYSFYIQGTGGPGFVNVATNGLTYDDSPTPTWQQWSLTMSNRFIYLAFDGESLVDAFFSARFTNRVDITRVLNDPNPVPNYGTAGDEFKKIWGTNSGTFDLGPTTFQLSQGEANQLKISTDDQNANQTYWLSYGQIEATGGPSTAKEAAKGFKSWLADKTDLNKRTAPFTPGNRVPFVSSLQVNDPLVHYSILDFATNRSDSRLRLPISAANATFGIPNDVKTYSEANMTTLLQPNPRSYRWGRAENSDEEYKYTLKDASVTTPDLWNFPSHKYPSVGWIGRIHRGTPWQSISLKSFPTNALDGVNLGVWATHVGQAAARIDTMPTNDWRLLDIFTTSIHPNLGRGRLSINQTNLAAWSAVFSGINTIQAVDDGLGGLIASAGGLVMQPDAIDDDNDPVTPTPLRRIVNGINQARGNLPYADKQFRRVSELMMVPELSLETPAIPNDARRINPSSNLTDSDYERLVEQIAGLVKVGEPRFVVYAWGQSLKPAERGVEARNNQIYPAGPSVVPGTRLVKNYQITGETAMRAVVKVEFTYKYDPSNNKVIVDANGVPVRHPRAVIESFNIIPTD